MYYLSGENTKSSRRSRTFAALFVFMDFSGELRELITLPHNIAIFSHRNPDGDAIGSALAMRHYLEQYGHNVHVMFPSDYPEEFETLPGAGEILIWDISPDECKQVLAKKDLYILLDFNAWNRIDRLGDAARQHSAKVLMIDHHLYPEPIADFLFSDTDASSTCEMVYRFIMGMGDSIKLNPTVGECIFTGLITDTGSFRHATNPAVYRIAADLVERGVSDTAAQDRIFNSQKEKNLRLLGHCLCNRMEIIPEYKTGIIWLSKRDYEDFGIQRGDTEGIVNYLLTLKDVRLAIFIHNQPTVVKLSMRSKGNLDVQEICRTHFNGGGHKNASGAYSHESLKNTLQKVKDLLPVYREAILKS